MPTGSISAGARSTGALSADRRLRARPSWRWVRVIVGTLILAAVVWRIGAGPVLAGLHRISPGLVVAALTITLLTTVSSAWRWQVIVAGLGLRMTLIDAFLAYYRSQFLNTVLPGGVVGDIHRAVDHGHRTGELGLAARAVAWERGAGQVVQAGLTATVLLFAGWPDRARTLLGALTAAVLLIAVATILRGRWRYLFFHELRGALLSRRAWPRILVSSTVVVIGHAGVLFLAARSAGVELSNARLISLCSLVLLATSIPLNVAGWGPREGAAAWLFAAAGSSAAVGLTAATVDGVLVLLACLPGVIVLIATSAGPPAHELLEEGAHGLDR